MKSLSLIAFALLFSSTVFAATAQKPKLVITTIDGQQFDLSKQSGKWVIVNYWATWCSPCLKELPDISAFVAANKSTVTAIGLDYEDSDKADVVKFLSKHPLSYAVAQVDTENPPKDFDTPKGLPNTYVIAPDGHVAKAFLGPVTAKDLAAVIAGD
ncbi:MAG: TlpA disulfide reductase family protein [Rudaea sp.]